ncbi:uncharacterized protein ISCGN_013499 [Ixodes scapularis]
MADSSSTSSEAKNPNILDGKFFKVIAEEDKHVKAIRQSCQKTISGSRSATSNFRTHLKAIRQSCQKTISGSRSATSNFRTHLKRIHPLVLVEYDEHVRRDPNQKKRQCTAGPEPALKQTRLVLATVPSAPVVTQTKFDSLLTDLIVKGMLPLTFVEQPEFVAFVKDSEDFELVTFEEIEPPGPLLSQHLRCACHTLSLIATADVKKAISANHALNRLHSSVMSKFSKYWGASGRPKSAEVVTSILGKQLPDPCITRWNSLHHAFDVLTQNKEKLQDLSNELQLPSLKSLEIEFIEE